MSSLPFAEHSEEGHDSFAADFEGDVFIAGFLRRGGGGVETQQQAALRNALLDLVEETGIADLIAGAFAGRLPLAFFGDHDGERVLQRPLPAFPGGPFDEVDFLQLAQPKLVEIADGGGPPFPGDGAQVGDDRGSGHRQTRGDIRLRPGVQVHLGNLAAAMEQSELFGGLPGHQGSDLRRRDLRGGGRASRRSRMII